jgi:hypothetical protein
MVDWRFLIHPSIRGKNQSTPTVDDNFKIGQMVGAVPRDWRFRPDRAARIRLLSVVAPNRHRSTDQSIARQA